MNATTQVNVYPRSTGTITRDYCTHRGVMLDRMDVVGPRGGRSVLWLAAYKRDWQMASWSATRDEAVAY